MLCLMFRLCSGADKSVTNMDGRTALEVAELNGQEDVTKVLRAWR